MTTNKKATPDVSTKRTAKTAAATRARAEKPAMHFYYSKALQKKTYAVLDALEKTPDHPEHGQAVADLVSELIEAGMDYYFLRALKLAKVGFAAEQSARIGMSGAVKLISAVSQQYIVEMDKTQLLVVARHIRSFT